MRAKKHEREIYMYREIYIHTHTQTINATMNVDWESVEKSWIFCETDRVGLSCRSVNWPLSLCTFKLKFSHHIIFFNTMLGATSVLKVDSMQRPCFFLDWGTSLYKNDSCKQLWKQLAVFFRGWWQSRGQAKDVLTFQSTAFLQLFPSYFMQKNLWPRKNPLLTLLLKYFKRALKKGRGGGGGTGLAALQLLSLYIIPELSCFSWDVQSSFWREMCVEWCQ